jgi:hypothetical protein
MSRSNCKVLDNGDRFPAIACDAVDGGRTALPAECAPKCTIKR